MFGEDTSKAYVALHYRINKNFFVFIKNKDNPSQDEYVARGELIIELLNAQGMSVAREIKTIGLTRTTLPNSLEPQSDIQGAISFAVPDGTFNIVFEVDDKESGRTHVDRKQTVTTRRPIHKPLEASIPFLVQMVIHEGAIPPEFEVVNQGQDVVYGTSCGYVVQMFLPDAKDLRVQWKMEGRWDDRFQERLEYSDSVYTLYPGIPKMLAGESEIKYQLTKSPYAWRMMYIPLPIERLETGFYQAEFEITQGENKTSLKRGFRVYWPNKPLSLMAFELAVDALRLIAKEDEVDEMHGFTSTRGHQRFRDFWRKRDPDTTTAYNEVMAEFYRRVDEVLRR
ncbi:MAG TPA: GWxTD domain-containing protein, partial [Bacteroidota bacterium]|nr:GWxTD domain-containing protein [Bacteroidota bacterium]